MLVEQAGIEGLVTSVHTEEFNIDSQFREVLGSLDCFVSCILISCVWVVFVGEEEDALVSNLDGASKLLASYQEEREVLPAGEHCRTGPQSITERELVVRRPVRRCLMLQQPF